MIISLTDPQGPQLLARVVAGDPSAFGEIYDRYSPSLYALLLRMLGNPDDAQEVLQETFVQIFNRASMYSSARGSEIAWLVSIARSRGIDRLRSRRVRDEREREAGREISFLTSNVDRDGSVEQAIASEEGKRVREALAALPEAQRATLELAYFEGLSQSEIAKKMNEPLGTVKTRTQLGLRKLRETLKATMQR